MGSSGPTGATSDAPGNAAPPAAPDFTLSVTSAPSALRNATVNLSVTLTRLGGFDGSVQISLQSPPVGFSATPITLAAGATTTTLPIVLSGDAACGSNSLTVSAAAASIIRTATPTVTVIGPGTLALGLSAASATVLTGGAASVTLTPTQTGCPSPSITYALDPPVAGVQLSSRPVGGGVELTFETDTSLAASAAPGTAHTLRVRGTGSNGATSLAPDFTLRVRNTVSGRVFSADGTPLGGVSVFSVGKNTSCVTSVANGDFSGLTVEGPVYTLVATTSNQCNFASNTANRTYYTRLTGLTASVSALEQYADKTSVFYLIDGRPSSCNAAASPDLPGDVTAVAASFGTIRNGGHAAYHINGNYRLGDMSTRVVDQFGEEAARAVYQGSTAPSKAGLFTLSWKVDRDTGLPSTFMSALATNSGTPLCAFGVAQPIGDSRNVSFPSAGRGLDLSPFSGAVFVDLDGAAINYVPASVADKIGFRVPFPTEGGFAISARYVRGDPASEYSAVVAARQDPDKPPELEFLAPPKPSGSCDFVSEMCWDAQSAYSALTISSDTCSCSVVGELKVVKPEELCPAACNGSTYKRVHIRSVGALRDASYGTQEMVGLLREVSMLDSASGAFSPEQVISDLQLTPSASTSISGYVLKR